VRIRWYGQSAFLFTGREHRVFVDPFADPSRMAARPGFVFRYPAIDAEADVLLITHEHFDHNAAEAVSGIQATVRSTAGTFETPIGTVLAVASEHDPVAGTRRGPNTIFVFELDGVRVAHFGDFGQAALRPEQRAAIGRVDLLLLPVGGGPTIGADEAAGLVHELAPRWVVPMHYRTAALNFLEPADAFLARMPAVHRLDGPEFDLDAAPTGDTAQVLVPAPPA
jgi:L-ascorbate metabolism protein UlaG (beta-lactamase superfamily)